VVESTALEMRHTGNRIGGSNPSLSAIIAGSIPDRQVTVSPMPEEGLGITAVAAIQFGGVVEMGADIQVVGAEHPTWPYRACV
jgi:hypothetical protein